ncbi:MAG: glycosyltransferase family 4 protein [Desulfovibrio sp.]|nr:glycosyltransferase family 4 protein [Desulfovibrio sp.]MBI4959525.1 glycosyltransferase family 4 protein [Desulfovibrio sp.]
MLIGFDVSQTGAGKAGCGYLAHGLVNALATRGTRFVFYPHFGDLYWEPNPKACSCPGSGCTLGPTFRWFEKSKTFWRKPPADFEARLGNPDIVHSNNFFCPTGLHKARLVYTLYDLSFMENPQWTTEQNRVGCLEGVFGASLRADFMLSISQATLEHFLRIYPHYPRERTAVMHLASRFGEQSPRRAPKRLRGVTPGEYWLCVGTIEPRKNQKALFEALAALPGKRQLVLAGGRGWLMDDMARMVSELGVASRVKLTGYVDDEELAWLYANCLGFVYPSLFEGFGLPVLEAMSLGAPVITSNVSSLPEVAGDAAILVDPLDTGAIAAAMARLEGDGSLRASLREAGLARAASFSWESAAQVAAEAYDRVLALPKYASQS